MSEQELASTSGKVVPQSDVEGKTSGGEKVTLVPNEVPEAQIVSKSLQVAAGINFFLGLGAFVAAIVVQAGNNTIKDAYIPKQGSYIGQEFNVPLPAVLSALGASFFGLTAVVIQAIMVIKSPVGIRKMQDIGEIVHKAALTFLHTEYKWVLPFVVVLFIFIVVILGVVFQIGGNPNWERAIQFGLSFLVGAILSALSGYMGMHIATKGHVRTCKAAEDSLSHGLQVAFRTGAVMGMNVVSLGVFGLSFCYLAFRDVSVLGGFGFGSSATALFARVGGGIQTKAADVGADLVGKVENDIPEDDPRNPATIADCVGDNVGDVAGMGADLFESFVGAVVAASVMGCGYYGEAGVALPFWMVAIGILICIGGTIHIKCNENMDLTNLLAAMRFNVIVSGTFIVIGVGVTSQLVIGDQGEKLAWLRLFGSFATGLCAGILIGWVTEYFTSHTFEPTRSISRAAIFGHGPVIIQGLGQGMFSTLVPCLLVGLTIIVAYLLDGFQATAISCVGMLSTLGVTMSTDAQGPVSDNAGGIAEMAELPPFVRQRTDLLDSLGNTTAATGKGFANGSALLSALSILAAFTIEANIPSGEDGSKVINLLDAYPIVGCLIGSLLPQVFGAMTMLAVNRAAQRMIWEVRRQFKSRPGILAVPQTEQPDYNLCVEISTQSSLKEMILPGGLAIFTPLIIGYNMGSKTLTGMLIGALCSGYLLGVLMSNAGGAWDNAKKWVEGDNLGKHNGKKSECHKAAVTGDTVGDPFKDTSGPSLNILIKLMTRFAFVLAPTFAYEPWAMPQLAIGLAILFIAIIFTLWANKFGKGDDTVMQELMKAAAEQEEKNL